MTVIIPHQNDDLKLIRLQDNLIRELNNDNDKAENTLFYKSVPLWIDITKISEETEDIPQENKKGKLKNIAVTIKKVTVKKLVYDNNKISALVEIIKSSDNSHSDYTYETKLPVINEYKTKESSYQYEEKKKNYIENIIEEINKDTEMNLKVFRVGAAHKPLDNSFAISESVWCKLK